MTEQNEKFAEAFCNLYKICLDGTNNSVDFDFKRIKLLEEMKIILTEQEPMKIFKKAHSKWEQELRDIIDKIEVANNELMEDLTDLSELISISN